jgi:hypothetical protein
MNSVAAVEHFISEMGAALERQALNQAHFGGCGIPLKHEKPTPLKKHSLHWRLAS